MININELIHEVERCRELLVLVYGWRVFTDVGDMQSPGQTVWFSSGYAHGEFTLTASIRKDGSGPAQHEVRVRITNRNVADQPGLGEGFAHSLGQAADWIENTSAYEAADVWPPKFWADYGLVLSS